MIIFPTGLLMYGWTAQAQTHWILPMIGSVVFSYGLMLCFNSLQNYLVDAFYPYGAAAMAGRDAAAQRDGSDPPHLFSDHVQEPRLRDRQYDHRLCTPPRHPGTVRRLQSWRTITRTVEVQAVTGHRWWRL